MSNVIAETRVRIRADTTGFKEEAERQVTAALDTVEAHIPIRSGEGAAAASEAHDLLVKAGLEAQKSIGQGVVQGVKDSADEASQAVLDAVSSRLEELKLRAGAALFRGDELKASQLEALQAIELVTFAAGEARKQLVEAVETDKEALADFLSAQIEAYEKATAELQGALAESQRTQTPVDLGPKDPTGGGGGGILDVLKQIGAGRSSGLGGLLALTSRLGLIGFAASTAFQAMQELQKALRVTGAEAFTTEGRLRNMGASLAGGDLIGGIKALVDAPDTIEELGAASLISAERLEAFTKVANGEAQMAKELAIRQDTSAESFKKLGLEVGDTRGAMELYRKITDEAGTSNQNLARDVVFLQKDLQDLDDRLRKTLPNMIAFKNAAGQILLPGAALGARGLGLPSPIPPGGMPGTIGGAKGALGLTNVQMEKDALAAAQRAGDLEEVENQLEIAVDRAQAAFNRTSSKNKALFETRRNELNTAKNALDAFQDTQAATARSAREGSISNNIARAALTEGTADNNRAFAIATAYWQSVADGAKKGSEEAVRAQGQLIQIQQAQQAAAEAAAASARAGREQALQNDIALAVLNENLPKIRKAYLAAIAYWEAVAAGTKEGSEKHEAAEAQILGLTSAMKSALAADPVKDIRDAALQNALAFAELNNLDTKPVLTAIKRFAFEAMKNAKEGTLAFEQARGAWIQASQNLKNYNLALDDLKRANARARAALTESENDDERLLRAEKRRLEKKVKATKGLGLVHQRAIQELLGVEKELAGLVDEIKPTTTVFDLLTSATSRFIDFAGNVVNAGNRFTADTFTGGIRANIGSSPNAAGRARLGIQDQITATDRNTTALDRLTATIRTGAGGSAVQAGANMANASRRPSRADVVGRRYQAMADRYAEIETARRARGGIS